MTREIIACMGGWCTKRDSCPHYRSDSIVRPAERLCVTGRDGVRCVEVYNGDVTLVDVFTGLEFSRRAPEVF